MSAGTPNREYKFLLVNSSDMSQVGWIKNASGKNLNLALNKPGDLSFSLSLEDPMSKEIYGYEVKRGIICYSEDKNGELHARWSGYISSATYTIDSNSTLNVSAIGWFNLLNFRELRVDSTFTAIDAGQILYQLLDDANNTTYGLNLLNNFSFEGGSYDYTLTGFTDSTTTTTWSTTGAVSLSLTSNAGSNSMTSNSYYTVYPSSNYTFSVDAYPNSSGINLIIDIKWYTSANALISTNSSTAYNGTDPYTVSVSATSPPTAAKAKVVINTSHAGTKTLLLDTAILVNSSTNTKIATPLTVTSPVTSSQSRTVTFATGTKHAQAIMTLVEQEAGFDFDVNPLTRKITVYYNNIKGSIYGKGSDQTNTIFGYNFGPKNILSTSVSVDSSIMANRFNAKGTYDQGVAFDENSVLTYGLFEETQTLSDVVDINILLGYAGAETAYRLTRFKTYESTPVPYDGNKDSIAVFDDYNIGDITYLNVVSPNISGGYTENPTVLVQNKAVRIFGLSINIDEEGNERVTNIQTVAS